MKVGWLQKLLEGPPAFRVIRISALDRASYRPWGAHTHAALRQWCSWSGITLSTEVAEREPPPAPAPVDAAGSLEHYLAELERQHLGSTWSPDLGVTQGEWFAMALERRRGHLSPDVEESWHRWLWWLTGTTPTNPNPRPPSYYERSCTRSFEKLRRLEPRHRPFTPP